MRAVLALLFVMATACGRIDFDPMPPLGLDAAASATSDAGAACLRGGCGTGQYCATPVGMCTAAGSCTPILTDPGVCASTPMCGCDGREYLNGCEAARAGQSIASIGPCTM